MGLFLDDDLDTFRNRKLDGMRLAEREIDDFTFELRAVADADNVHILLKSGSDAMNRIGHQRPRQAVQRAMLFGGPFHVQHAVLLFKADALWNGTAQFPLGAPTVHLLPP